MNKNIVSPFYELEEVTFYTKLSRSHIYSYMAQGKFPKAKKLSDRRVAWLKSDIDIWISQLEDAA
jgi:predicted DNA-binding transcriptional regulator AlpA